MNRQHRKGDAALAAFQFLSRFPVNRQLDFNAGLLQKSTVYYPLVGAAIGLLVCGCSLLAAWLLPNQAAAAVTLIVWVAVTGGLHLDGWMDSADALLSYRSRERMLEIMKDSRVGAMGVLSCVLLLLLKYTLLAGLLQRGPVALAALGAAPVWSRWFLTYAISRWPSAKGNEGLAGLFSGQKGRFPAGSFTWAWLLSLLAFGGAVFLAEATGFNGPAATGLPPAGAALLLFLLLPLVNFAAGAMAAGRMAGKLGGLTGDTYGALNEGLEALLLLAALLVLH